MYMFAFFGVFLFVCLFSDIDILKRNVIGVYMVLMRHESGDLLDEMIPIVFFFLPLFFHSFFLPLGSQCHKESNSSH